MVVGKHLEVSRRNRILSSLVLHPPGGDRPGRRSLEALSREQRRPRRHVTEYLLHDGRVLRLLAEGRLVNLAAAEGHPAAVMDMSFANQALAVAYIVREGRGLDPAVHPMPEELDAEVASLKLASLGVAIDTLTEEQQRYLSSWREGT